uniref:Uncharacterized protein n=1 Tax=Rhizophora mucronata TaxID=61149 RepID=A0A2P2Q651_RHIMU
MCSTGSRATPVSDSSQNHVEMPYSASISTNQFFLSLKGHAKL